MGHGGVEPAHQGGSEQIHQRCSTLPRETGVRISDVRSILENVYRDGGILKLLLISFLYSEIF